MKITCAFQYELYVDETRRAALSRNAGCRRFVFNKALGIQNERKSKGEKLLTYKELAHDWCSGKNNPRPPFFKRRCPNRSSRPCAISIAPSATASVPIAIRHTKGGRSSRRKTSVTAFGFRNLLLNTSTMQRASQAPEDRLDSIPQNASHRVRVCGRDARSRCREADSRQEGLRPLVRDLHG